MNTQPTAYIAGPMRAIPEFNFPAFFAAEAALHEAGWLTINPARHDVDDTGFDPKGMTGNEDLAEFGFDLAEALSWDLEQIAKNADAVVLLPGWERSKGARAEVALAEALGKRVCTLAEATLEDFENGDEVREWFPRFWLIRGNPNTFDWPAETVDWTATVEQQGADATGNIGVDGNLYAKACLERVTEPTPLAVRYAHLKPAPQAVVADLPHGHPAKDGEVRITSETGGQKGKKPAQLSTVDPLALLELAKVSGFGAGKYESFNYVRGYDWRLSADAAFRHLLAFLSGEDNDPESGLPHTAHFAWHGLALTSFLLRGVGTDDRVETVLEGYRQAREEVAA